MTKQESESAPDGRRLRSERSRQAIIDAMLNLVEEGILVPTAQQVSERAGVGIRSVFRHFNDMESLFATADTRIREQYQGLFAGGNRDGSLQDRLLHAVEQRALSYEAIGNQFLTTKAQLWRYPDAVASFEYWNRLREHQSLGRKTSIKLVTRLLESIILDD